MSIVSDQNCSNTAASSEWEQFLLLEGYAVSRKINNIFQHIKVNWDYSPKKTLLKESEEEGGTESLKNSTSSTYYTHHNYNVLAVTTKIITMKY